MNRFVFKVSECDRREYSHGLLVYLFVQKEGQFFLPNMISSKPYEFLECVSVKLNETRRAAFRPRLDLLGASVVACWFCDAIVFVATSLWW